jgi:hypothetical protein
MRVGVEVNSPTSDFLMQSIENGNPLHPSHGAGEATEFPYAQALV